MKELIIIDPADSLTLSHSLMCHHSDEESVPCTDLHDVNDERRWQTFNCTVFGIVPAPDVVIL